MDEAYQDEMAAKRFRDDHWRREEALLTEIRDLLRLHVTHVTTEAIVITQGAMTDEQWQALREDFDAAVAAAGGEETA